MSQDPLPPLPQVRTGQTPTKLTKEEYLKRWRQQFYDPAFMSKNGDLEAIAEIAWDAYQDERKSPRTRKAGPGFADPEYELSVEWLKARQAIIDAQKRQESPDVASRVLLICASPRTDQTCPSEMSKTFRLARSAREVIDAVPRFEVDFVDLSVMTAEYGRVIYPCKACVSTAMPLCHWPCSSYPNHYLGQSQDWMNEIYPRWVVAHGIMIITPVHWYQVPSTLKLMMDRLVCADGGNPDPTSTHGKDRDGFRDGASGASAAGGVRAPIDFSKYRALTIICAIACISATAGVVEEAGFRGFLISPIQRRHGWTIAILISGIMFFLDHRLSHAYATFVFLPFFLAISAVHGLLVKYSGSIRPSILLHALADFIVIPVTYGLVGSFSVESLSVTGIDRHFIIWVAVMVICLGAFVPALRVLRRQSETAL